MRKSLLILILVLFIGGLLAGLFLIFSKQLPVLQNQTQEVKASFTKGYHITAALNGLKTEEPQDVLLLFQNNLELRGTGGFITAIGHGTLVNGYLSDLNVVASNSFNEEKLKLPMPNPMGDWLSTETLKIRDANWDPDFATSAHNISSMYKTITGQEVDLVLAITSRANEQFLKAIGPLSFTVNGHTLDVDSSSVTATLEQYTDIDFAKLGLQRSNRKEILASYAASLLPKIVDFAIAHPTQATAMGFELLARYDLQIWSTDSTLDGHLQALNARREVENYTGDDALLIVDTNLNARKTDGVIEQSLDYKIDLNKSVPTATLSITYINEGEESPLYTTYNDYLRVYVPLGSELLESSIDKPETLIRHGRTIFAGMVQVAPGKTKTVTMTYKLGPTVSSTSINSYRLQLERQAGTRGMSVKASVKDDNDSKEHETTLDSDKLLTIDGIR